MPLRESGGYDMDYKEFIDGIGTESERDHRIIELIYGFTRTGFLESRADKGGAA